jgi:hypothetical protein
VTKKIKKSTWKVRVAGIESMLSIVHGDLCCLLIEGLKVKKTGYGYKQPIKTAHFDHQFSLFVSWATYNIWGLLTFLRNCRLLA